MAGTDAVVNTRQIAGIFIVESLREYAEWNLTLF
jgi:hypothetical protein